MFHLARMICGQDSAADVVQDAFVRIWQNPERFDSNRGSLRQYLMVTTRGVAFDHLRRTNSGAARDTRHVADAEPRPDDPARRLIHHETTAVVISALARLAEPERRAIMEAFYNGLTYREVAVLLGVPEGTVKSRIRSGLTRLRSDLRADGLEAGRLIP